ncbi:hypothetical protein ABB37_07489 [Leptomonas pyrrhocoris]|uniref:Uncharacterized protein n=1 Tax=Leptomonas pyrrhocoris TaxID=157538 RepID=A0A0M9FUZ9_LEPPY|nr:hypothetical protein ABB37_07489 [Leptomonas pyrrhocoris]KPA76630.1 hypothetical protein ABB37_07489 [Leptomonas pyrrhocoris]|eukprot:XP_015655069.1 hypothetical protein ABB37_07489 [Leptomonas pyrrhocoris]
MPIGITSSPAVQSRGGYSHGPLRDAVYADTKCFHAKSAVVAVAASYNSTIWLALQDGRVEVRDAHTGQAIHEFAASHTRQQKTKVWCVLSVFDVLHQEAQMWLGLSSGAIEVYTEAYVLRRHLSKHLSGVYCLTQYRGAVVYAGSTDFTITQWRVHDGQLLRVLTGHANYIRCLYAEGNALVSGSDDNTIRVWDVASGGCLQQYGHLHRESGGVSALCRVGTAMWSGDHSGAIAVWRLKDGLALLVCRQLTSRVTSLRKVGSRVYAGSAEGRICVFSANDCTVVSRLDDHLGSNVFSITCAVEVNRYFVWSGSADNTVRCWHHDEHQPMTSDREGFLDMRWYYTTQRPNLQANEELLEQHREASELVVLSSGSDDAVQSFLDGFGEGNETAAARYWLQDSKLKQTQKKCDKAEEETRSIEAVVGRKTQVLSLLQQQLAKLTEALQTARRNQPALAQSIPPVTVAGVPSVLPAVLPPSTVPAVQSLAGPLAAAPPVSIQQIQLPPGTTPLPSLPPSAVPLPPPTSSLISALTPVSLPPAPPQAAAAAAVPPPPPPPAVVPTPPPSTTTAVPVTERSPSVSTRVITTAQVTRSHSFEPVLGALPPPPPSSSAAATGGPKKTLGALLRRSSGPTSSSLSSASPYLSPITATPPQPPTVVVLSLTDTAKTSPDTPIPKPAAPRARRMSF